MTEYAFIDPSGVERFRGGISPAPGGSVPESLLALASVTISSAELLTLDTIPVELIPAPGGRFYYVVHSVELHYRFGTTPYSGAGLGYLVIGYGPLTSEAWWLGLAALGDGPNVTAGSFLTQTEDAYAQVVPDPGGGSASFWLASEIEDKPITLGMADSESAPVADGDGTLTVRIWYSLIDGAPA